jgi:polyphosphate kinase
MERERALPPTAADADRVHPFASSRYFNREATWLDFNERVIALAEDGSLPLLERVKFLAISSRNLDPFFHVRVRVEVVVPVESPPLAARIEEVLTLCLADGALAWELRPDGAWERARGGVASRCRSR